MTGLLTERLRQASDNAVAMWSTLARARGDAVVDHSAFTVIDGRRFRIMLRTATPGETDKAELTELARAKKNQGRTVVVEDPFRVLDLSDGMTAGQLPVMVREPAPAPDPGQVEPRRNPRRAGEGRRRHRARLSAGGVPAARTGTVFPPRLLTQAGPAFFTKGDAGACLTMAHGGVGGAYWVTTLPEHRSRGVGRALTHAVLRHFEDLPVTLSASRAGRPLYEKLGFVNLGDANWWR